MAALSLVISCESDFPAQSTVKVSIFMPFVCILPIKYLTFMLIAVA